MFNTKLIDKAWLVVMVSVLTPSIGLGIMFLYHFIATH